MSGQKLRAKRSANTDALVMTFLAELRALRDSTSAIANRGTGWARKDNNEYGDDSEGSLKEILLLMSEVEGKFRIIRRKLGF